MKRVFIKNSRDLNIAGILNESGSVTKTIVIISHGSTSNKDKPRFLRLEKELSKNGIDSLRFDFGGSGESYDNEMSLEDQVDDLKSVIQFVKRRGYEKIGLLGHSLGGLISVLVCSDVVKTMVLWAPVTDFKIPGILKEEGAKKELKEIGYLIKEKDGKKFKFTDKYFAERQCIDQNKILSKLKCPVLIIHGDLDDTVPLEQSKSAMKYLSNDSKLDVIKDGDHKLDNKIDVVAGISADWFRLKLNFK